MDIAVAARRGRISVSELVAAGPVVAAFHRLWCPFCQEAARDLAGVKDHLDAAGARVVLVYRDDVDTVCASCAQRGIPFECVSDSGRELENATEIERFSIARYAAFSPSKLVRALRSGSRVGRPDSGVLQGRGTFVVDGGGRIVYAHHSTTAADIPPIADVLAAVQSIARRPDQRTTT
jgi:peroxiredoxin